MRDMPVVSFTVKDILASWEADLIEDLRYWSAASRSFGPELLSGRGDSGALLFWLSRYTDMGDFGLSASKLAELVLYAASGSSRSILWVAELFDIAKGPRGVCPEVLEVLKSPPRWGGFRPSSQTLPNRLQIGRRGPWGVPDKDPESYRDRTGG